MIVHKTMSLEDKLKILSAAARYDVSCTSSGVDRKGEKGTLGNAAACYVLDGGAADDHQLDAPVQKRLHSRCRFPRRSLPGQHRRAVPVKKYCFVVLIFSMSLQVILLLPPRCLSAKTSPCRRHPSVNMLSFHYKHRRTKQASPPSSSSTFSP